MKEFNFNSQVCTDKVQSERLLALGLKKETADCYFFYCDIAKEWKRTIMSSTQVFKDYPTTVIPAWSLHRLIEMIGDMFEMQHWLGFNIEKDYDHTIDCIEWLIEDNRLNKEYLV